MVKIYLACCIFINIYKETKLGGNYMADNNNLGSEWRSTAYNLGGAFVELGKTLMHSIKKGVDIAYDAVNDFDDKNRNKKGGNSGNNGN